MTARFGALGDLTEEAVIDWLIATSWQVALLVAIVACLNWTLRRALSPRFRLALWSIVALRLVVPALPEVDGGVLREEWPREVMSVATGDRTIRASRPPSPREPVAPARAERRAGPRSEASDVRAGLAPTPAAVPTLEPSGEIGPSWRGVTLWSWGGVGLALLLGLLACELRFRRRVARSAVASCPVLRDEVERGARDLGLRRRVEVRVLDGLSAPAVTGIVRPCMLLPDGWSGMFSAEERRLVFLHELAHVRHHDVLWNAVLAVLQCVWWFHPLVHFAFTRLRRERESVRDFEALAATAGSDESLRYARTLLKLVEERRPRRGAMVAVGILDGGADLRRRIVMVSEYSRRPGRVAALLGASVVGLAVWAGFTRAAPPDSLVAPSQTQERLRHLVVERQEAPPAWQAELERRLDGPPVSVQFETVLLQDAAAYLSQFANVPIVVMPEAADYGLEVDLAGELAPRDVLGLICSMERDLDWCMAREAIAIGCSSELPEALHVRVYNLTPFFQEYPGIQIEDVMDIGQELMDQRSGEEWDREGTWMEHHNKLLLVRQTDRNHRAFQEALELALNRGRRPAPADAPWRARVAKDLDKRVKVSFDDVDLGEVCAWLDQLVEAPVVLDEPDLAGESISLQLGEVTVGSALDWIADLVGQRAYLADGAVHIGGYGGQVVEFHEIADLARRDDGDDGSDTIVELVLNSVDPDSWDMDPRNFMVIWQGILVVRQSPPNQQRIRALLDSMRRASRAG